MTRHVVTGGLVTGRFQAAPRVRISIPANWRTAERTSVGGRRVAQLKDVQVKYVEAAAQDTDPWQAPILVERSAELAGNRPRGERDLPPEDGAIYLIREQQRPEHLQVDVIGYDGWPPVPVELASFEWPVKENEIRGWQENPLLRGPAQIVTFAVGIGLIVWIADGGLGDLAERDGR